jgi:hypothetical protein
LQRAVSFSAFKGRGVTYVSCKLLEYDIAVKSKNSAKFCDASPQCRQARGSSAAKARVRDGLLFSELFILRKAASAAK